MDRFSQELFSDSYSGELELENNPGFDGESRIRQFSNNEMATSGFTFNTTDPVNDIPSSDESDDSSLIDDEESEYRMKLLMLRWRNRGGR